MRRFIQSTICLLLVVCILFADVGGALPGMGLALGHAKAESSATLYVSNAEQLRAALTPENYDATIILTADIDLGSYEPTLYLQGVLDGRGHTVSYTQSQGFGGRCGLVAGLTGDGQIINLNVDADITISTDNAYTCAGLICGVIQNDASVTNCRVSGSVHIDPDYACSTVFAGGITGLAQSTGVIADCSSDASLVIRNDGDTYAGGIAGANQPSECIIVGCSNSGSVAVIETRSSGANHAFKATGISSYNLYECDFSGSVYVETVIGTGNASGLWNSQGGSCGGFVEGRTVDGTVYATGVESCDNVDNDAIVTATATGSGSVEAAGLVDTYGAANNGVITATAVSGDASAYGSGSSADYAINRGTVTASSSEGTAYAVGVTGGSGMAYQCVNYGQIFASSDSCKSVAVGMANVSTGTNSGAVSSEIGSGTVVAQGLVGCRFSTNTAGVTSTYQGADGTVGHLTAQGLNSCYACENHGKVRGTVNGTVTCATVTGSAEGSYNKNYGAVLADAPVGQASARGVKGKYCENFGTVTAMADGPKLSDNGSASAYGVYESVGCINHADVFADSTYAGAVAYGYTGADCASEGTVYATATYVEVGEDGVTYTARARAYNSTSVVAVSSAGTASASGGDRRVAYRIVPRSGCTMGHVQVGRAVLDPNDSRVDGCCTPIGVAYSEADSGCAAPEYPENTDVGGDEYDDGDFRAVMDFQYITDSGEILFTSFERACGSLRPAVDGVEFGDKFTVRIRSWGDPSGAEQLTLTLPHGFSFSESSLVTEAALTVTPGLDNPGIATVDVWPIYLDGTGQSTVSFCLYRQEELLINKSANVQSIATEGDIDVRPTAGVSTHPGTPIRVNALTDYGVDFAKNFISGPTSYQQSLADLTCALSQSVYGTTTGDEQAYIIPAFENLGCTDYKWYAPGDPANEVAICLAQKKVILDDTLRNILFVVVRGTYDWDWIGNFDAFGNAKGHNNFLGAASAAAAKIDDYVAQYMTEADCAMTRVCVTGHSRGAAVADILCRKMALEGWDSFWDTKTAYTFATPSAFTSMQPADPDVTNIIFMHDLVGFVPMSMYKYGTTYVVGSIDNEEAPDAVRQLFGLYTGVLYDMPDNSALITIGNVLTEWGADIVKNPQEIKSHFLHPDLLENPLPDSPGDLLRHFPEYLVNKYMKENTGTTMTEYIRDNAMQVDNLHWAAIWLGAFTALPNRDRTDAIAQAALDYVYQDRENPGFAIAHGHGAEMYMAWVHGNGVAGSRSYESAVEAWLNTGVGRACTLLEKELGDKVKSGALLYQAGSVVANKAIDAVDAAVAFRDQMYQKLNDAACEAERLAAQAALAAAQAALEQAEHARDATLDLVDKWNTMHEQWDFPVVQPMFLFPAMGTSIYGGTFIGVMCPVDVNISGGDGGVDVGFANHTLTSMSWEHYGEAVGDGYLLFLQNNEAADLSITATGDGRMGIIVLTLDSNMNISTVESYVDVPVAAGETFSMHLASGTTRGQQLISSTGQVYEPDGVNDLKLLRVDAAPETAQLGDTLTFTAKSMGGEGTVTYTFTVLKDGEPLGEPIVQQESTLELTPEENGSYRVEVTVSDTAGHSDGPMESPSVVVWSDQNDGNWTCVVDLKENVLGSDGGPWMGNLYNVRYQDTWLDSWEDYEVTVTTDREGATVTAELTSGWNDGVNFFLYGVYDDCTLNLFITVKKKTVTNEDYADLILHQSVHVVSVENAVAPTLAEEVDGSHILATLYQSQSFTRPKLNGDGIPADNWWVGITSDDDSICSVWVQDEELYYYPANPGTTRLNIVARSFDACITLYSRTVTVLAEGETANLCGDSASWSLSGDGVLTISGTGAVWDYGCDPEQNTTPPWYNVRDSIRSLVVEEGITRLGAYLLPDCGKVTGVSLPASLTEISPDAFGGCGGIEEFHVADGNGHFTTDGGVLLSGSLQQLVRYPAAKKSAQYAVPSSVTEILSHAFADNLSLHSIVLPASVRAVNTRAFENVPLNQVYYGDTQSRRADIAIDNAGGGNRALLDAQWICVDSCDQTLFLPSSLTVIGQEAFCGADTQVIVVPEGCRRIESRAFADCPNLTLVWLPAGLNDIAEDAFAGSPVTILRR